jgi:hypothetical protein
MIIFFYKKSKIYTQYICVLCNSIRNCQTNVRSHEKNKKGQLYEADLRRVFFPICGRPELGKSHGNVNQGD